MKKLIWLCFLLIFFYNGVSFASPLNPEIILENGNKVVRLGTGETDGESSWIWRPFVSPVDTSVHTKVTVSFDLYRQYPVVGGSGHQQMNWSFVDETDSYYGDMQPSYGVSERYGIDNGRYQIYPFGWSGDYINDHVDTVFDRWVNITLEWDFAKVLQGYTGWASAWYDGTAVILNREIVDPEPFLAGWDMTLWAPYASETGEEGGSETVLIDNLVITGSDIYNSYGFENFDLGFLNGQDGWIAGTNNGVPAVPEPGTMVLFSTGLLILAGIKRWK